VKQDKVIAVHTDSIITKYNSIPEGNNIGEMKLKVKGECVILATGIYSFREEKTRFRGIKRTVDLFSIARKYKKEKEIELEILKPIHLGEIINFNRIYTLDDLNKFMPIKKKISVNMDMKRLWIENFENWGELLEKTTKSAPLHSNLCD
jgi:hypothetical protein